MLPLHNIIHNHDINFHCYADDTQLYISTKPDTIAKQSTLEACLKDMKEWMAHNFLLLNSGKTEIFVVSSKSIRNKMPDISLHFDGVSVASSAVIKTYKTYKNTGLLFLT